MTALRWSSADMGTVRGGRSLTGVTRRLVGFTELQCLHYVLLVRQRIQRSLLLPRDGSAESSGLVGRQCVRLWGRRAGQHQPLGGLSYRWAIMSA